MTKQLSIRMQESLYQETARAVKTARYDLEQYYILLLEARRGVRLSLAEVQVLRACVPVPDRPQYCPREYISDHVRRKYSGSAILLASITGWTQIQAAAVLDLLAQAEFSKSAHGQDSAEYLRRLFGCPL